MEENYRIIPKKQPITFPEPEKREDQYNQPIGPIKQTTAERITYAARSAGNKVGSAVQQFTSNPVVQKAGHIVKDRAEVFEHNIALNREQQQRQRQEAQQQKPRVGRVQATQPQPRVRPIQPVNPQKLAAQDDPFGVRGGGHDEPMGRGLGKRSNVRTNDDPFGIRRG